MLRIIRLNSGDQTFLVNLEDILNKFIFEYD